ncbi:rhamnose ABC transporter substrate-binding protein [Pseudalkalibacillus salsuginis]|uniref:rhamnose ABC transporter substrate-binding protein n=1 Tax=Pseudalkalibacillus salsuginis TaxID=2910972 RepID=UPI001F3443AF|nr:rhamnose ABC transporter substrate-binding protein [Pseudalkalibacillus salsuginis]MCF6411392.1 rhamnose ABC transporter substrate-binding protein [Pseudalkalibacillus salsuginis]
MKRFVNLGLLMSLLLVFLAACGSNQPAEGGDGKAKHAVVFKNTGNPYGEKEMEGFKNAIEDLGGEAILRAPDDPSVEDQVKIIEELISQQVDSIAVVANDYDGLEPALKKAMNKGIKVLSLDSAVNGDSRMVHVNQADPEAIGRTQIEAVSEMIDGKGQIAILSATSQASNQNLWIEWMKKELEKPEYKDIELVKVAYGDDLRDKSVSETEALLQSYPDLKAIVAPTTVGIAAAAKVITDKGLIGDVVVTGLGLPSEMAAYIENGATPWMYLWNPLDVGYLAGHASHSLVEGDITGEAGDKFKAGELGEYEIIEGEDGTEILLGDPFRFDKENIEEWKEIY